MSLGWTLMGTLGQLMLAPFLFMLVAFSGGGLVSGRHFRPAQVKVLDISLLALPGACALSAVIVLYLHWHGSTAHAYWWYALPLLGLVLYMIYFQSLIRQARRSE